MVYNIKKRQFLYCRMNDIDTHEFFLKTKEKKYIHIRILEERIKYVSNPR